MSDIFREVDEALQQDRLKKIWDEYGKTIILAAIVMVVSTAIGVTYRNWDLGRDQAETGALFATLEQGADPDALSRFADDTRAGHAAIARMTSAGLYAEKGDFEKSAALYKEIYQSSGPAIIKDFARIFYTRAVLMSADLRANPENDPQALLALLEPVTTNKDNPAHWMALLDKAYIQGNIQNNYSGALETLAPFDTAQNVPASLVDKARALTDLYALQHTEKQS